MNDALSMFAQDQGTMSKSQQAMAGASAEGRGSIIEVPGTYRMRVKTVVSHKDQKEKIWPSFFISDQPKSLGCLKLQLCLECVDGTDAVSKGDTFFHTLTVAQGPKATQEKISNTVSFVKPILAALTGIKDIQFTEAFLRDHFTVDVSGGKVVRTHKMTKDVMVVLDNGEYNNKITLGVKNIRPAADAEVSRSTKLDPQAQDRLKSEIAGSKKGPAEPMDMDFDQDNNPVPGSGESVEDS